MRIWKLKDFLHKFGNVKWRPCQGSNFGKVEGGGGRVAEQRQAREHRENCLKFQATAPLMKFSL
jgi:hypothetical protein